MTDQADHKLEKLLEKTAKPNMWLSPGFLRRAGESVGFLAFCYFVIVVVALVNGNSEVMGQFGDAFGVLTSLFAFISTLLVAYALHIQIRELGLLRNEISDQKKHAKLMATETKETRKLQELTRKRQEQIRYLDEEPRFIIVRSQSRDFNDGERVQFQLTIANKGNSITNVWLQYADLAMVQPGNISDPTEVMQMILAENNPYVARPNSFWENFATNEEACFTIKAIREHIPQCDYDRVRKPRFGFLLFNYQTASGIPRGLVLSVEKFPPPYPEQWLQFAPISPYSRFEDVVTLFER